MNEACGKSESDERGNPGRRAIVLVRYRAGKNVDDEDQQAADAQRKEAFESSCLSASCASGARTIKRERAEIL